MTVPALGRLPTHTSSGRPDYTQRGGVLSGRSAVRSCLTSTGEFDVARMRDRVAELSSGQVFG